MNSPQQSMYINIQALRAFAVVVIIVVHAGYPWFFGHVVGDYAVELFFVISGFLMTHICYTNPDHYVLRRLVRILPMYWLVSIGLFLLGKIAPSLVNFSEADFTSLYKTLLFIPYQRPDGFAFPILPVGWTLNYEMFFYGLLALLILALGVMKTTWRRYAALCCIPALTVVWYVCSLNTHFFPAKFFSELIVFEFLLGILCFYLYHSSFFLSKKSALLLAFLSFISLPALNIWLDFSEQQSDRFLKLGVPSFLLVYSMLVLERRGTVLGHKWIIFIGDASYSIYLCHMFVVFFVGRVIAPLLDVQLGDSFLLVLIAALLSILIGGAMYSWIEKPTTRFLRKNIFHV